jgi:anti-anti-sigma regulatory factor
VVLDVVRERVHRAHKPFATGDAERVDVFAEFAPFVECAFRALRESSTPSGVSWNEARSMLWLFAHRMADHGVPAAVVVSALASWRVAVTKDDERSSELSAMVFDELFSLVIDGYARGVEERERLRAQRALAAAAPVRELEPGLLIAIAAGALDAEGAQQFAERVAREALRRDARAVVLDVSDLEEVTPSVLAELWAIASAARTLGARTFVGGVRGVVHELLQSAGITNEGEVRVAHLSEALRLARESLIDKDEPELPWWKRWLMATRARRHK